MDLGDLFILRREVGQKMREGIESSLSMVEVGVISWKFHLYPSQ